MFVSVFYHTAAPAAFDDKQGAFLCFVTQWHLQPLMMSNVHSCVLSPSSTCLWWIKCISVFCHTPADEQCAFLCLSHSSWQLMCVSVFCHLAAPASLDDNQEAVGEAHAARGAGAGVVAAEAGGQGGTDPLPDRPCCLQDHEQVSGLLPCCLHWVFFFGFCLLLWIHPKVAWQVWLTGG